MASTDKKKFKITETSKQASVDITSDKIQLSADSADHVLVAKIPSSANLSGSVNVEVEMSPDGQNWCNAVRREVVSTAPSSTGNVIGNEQMVQLIPSATEPKNKHARGSLNFDDNGNTVATFNAGTRDFMHQHIHKSKSFNYSQWFKTSEAPTTTYKPVLFRHGGYDNFENTHVIETDGTSNTQNLVESKSTYQTVYNGMNGVNGATGGGGSRFYIEPNSDAATFYGFSGITSTTAEASIELENGKFLTGMWRPSQAFSSSRWYWSQLSTNSLYRAGWKKRTTVATGYPHANYVTGSYQRFLGYLQLGSMIAYSANDASTKILNVSPSISQSSTGYWYVYSSNPILTFTKKSDNTTFDVNLETGFHHVITYTPPADFTQGIPEANVACYINGEQVKINVTTEGGTDYVLGAAPSDNLFYGDESYAATSNWTGSQAFVYGTTYRYYSYINNHMDFQRELSASEAALLYNGGKLLDFSNMQTSFPISLSNCVGAYDSDVALTDWDGTYSVPIGFEDCSGFGKHIRVSPSNSTAATRLAPAITLSFMATTSPLLEGKFTTSSNLSISGWFKTTADATGVLFSNTEGSAASGLKLDVNASDMTINFIATSAENITVNSDVNDEEWHHLVITKNDAGTNQFTVYVDGVQVVQDTATIADTDLKGGNGFTLLSDGQNNAHASPAASTDASKLNAAISNWSIHSEVLDANAVKQLYSNGHARNIRNLPSVTRGSIEAWWQLSDATNPENDVSGKNIHLQYEDGAGNTLVSQRELATGAVKVVDSINGNGMTLSLTKSFNFTTNEWVSTADQDAALCLSFNGFEEQAEYFALWKCAQTPASGALDLLDGNWHNVTLSYRSVSSNSQADGHLIRFGPNGTSNYNWNISMDGEEMYNINSGLGADAIGGLNSLDASNQGFVIQNRHLRYDFANDEEEYKAHSQFSAGVNETNSADSPYSFQAYVDETSFHSESWWVAGSPNSFNAEKPATIYGNTGGANNRGTGTEYPEGVPYPLLNPEKLTSSGDIADIQGTNQYIDPNRYDASTNTDGGLEAWWRWGDTPDDCQITINDVKDAADGQNYRDLIAFELSTSDVINLTSADSIYNAAATASSGGTSVQYNQIKLQDLSTLIGTATCAVKDFISPVFQYLRIKLTGSGTCDIGEGKLEIEVNHKKRRMK